MRPPPSLHPDLRELTDVADIDTLLETSKSRPVLLFKHSVSCGTSAQALDELHHHLEAAGAHDAQFAIVTVQFHRAVSNALAQRLGIRHETPQALLIRDGEVVWHASHFRVTAKSIAAALAEHAG